MDVHGCHYALDWAYDAQEFHQLVTDLGRGFVLYPVARSVEFETSHETSPSGRQIEVRFGGAVVIESAVKAGTPEFSDVMSHVIGFCP